MDVMCYEDSDVRYKTIFFYGLFLFIVFHTICPDECSRVSYICTYVHTYIYISWIHTYDKFNMMWNKLELQNTQGLQCKILYTFCKTINGLSLHIKNSSLG